MLKRKSVHYSGYSLVLLILLLASGLILVFSNSIPVNASPRTFLVPRDYATIGSAIDNVSPGDTILVKKGIYYENLVVDKSVTLLADVGNVTVIGEGGVERGAKAVFTLAADGITLANFKIQSQNYSAAPVFATAVNVVGDKCTISNNSIQGTYYGIFSSVQSYNVISGNNISGVLKDGIRICGGSYDVVEANLIEESAQSGIAIDGYFDTVKQNFLIGNGRGIGLGSSYSVIFGNDLKKNVESGLYVAASDSIIVSNNITQSKWGVYFTSYFAAPNNNTFYHNNFIGNSQPIGTSSVFNYQAWDNGTSGNYWSSYNGSDLDGDGLGDSSYPLIGNDVDKFPLMIPYWLLANNSEPMLSNQKNSTVRGLVSAWHFDVVGPNGVTADSVGNNPVVLEASGGDLFTPILVDGHLGKALRFNGSDYAYVTSSPSMNANSEFTIDAWVCLQDFKNVAYNNIFVECMRTPEKFPTRIFGFAINGEDPQNDSSPSLGALRGFLLNDDGEFNEVVTTTAIVTPNNWIHVALSRSTTNGIQIYVNGVVQDVRVTSGVQNPTGSIAKGTEFYIGHDSMITLDELSFSNIPIAQTSNASSFSFEWWFWITIAAGASFLFGLAYWLRKSHLPTA
jgi:nitrous oxidase accessory protein